MIFLLYFLKVFLYSGILFGYYWLFLRNRRFHHYNRYYLLATLVLSVTLPFIKIPVFNEGQGALHKAIYQTVSIVSASADEYGTVTAVQQEPSLLTVPFFSWLLYAVVALLLLALFFRSLWYIRKISQRYSFELIKQLKFYQTQEPGTPFSFFRSVFWNDQLSFNSPEGQQIFRHELFHVEQKHTVDIILAELITIAGWLNPFFYLIKKELKAIHEFLADQYATSGSDRYAYAELLVHSFMKSKNLPLTHPFFQHHLKRRVSMIIQHNNTRYGYWSRLMALPVSLLLFFSMALHAQQKKQHTIPANATTITQKDSHEKIIADTAIPANEQQVLMELKLKAEQQVIRAQQLMQENNKALISDTTIPLNEQKLRLELKLKAEEEIVRKQLILRDTKLRNEELENKQLMLQKILAEKNVKDEKVNLAVKQELQAVHARQLELQQTQNNAKQLTLKQEKEQTEKLLLAMRNDAAKRNAENVQSLQLKVNEKELLEKERASLIIEQKQLELKENKKEFDQRLKAVQEQKQVLDLVLQEKAVQRSDTMEKAINRYLCRTSRFPEFARSNAGQGSVYCSVFIDEDGKFNDFKSYDELPQTAGGNFMEIVIVSFTDKGHTPGNASEADIRKAFKEEAERIFKKAPGIATHGKIEPKLYFFKLTFRLEQDK